MSYFNITTNNNKPTTINKEGGKNFKLTPELELATLLTTSNNMNNKFYENSDDRVERLKKILEDNKNNPAFIKFAAKAIIYTRKTAGLKTISHLATALMTKYTPGLSWNKKFYKSVINYIPDISETLAAYKALYRNDKNIGTIPKAMKVSFSDYLKNANCHLASKWQMSNKTISLIDLVRILHVKNEWTDELIKNGKLKPAETKEVLLSTKVAEAKADGKTPDEIELIKNQIYADLNSDNKMGYYAMITGLVQISSGTDEQIDIICKKIINREAIKKSLIHPLQLTVAYYELMKRGGNGSRKLIAALSDAIELCYNIPEVLENATADLGKTCIMLDISGSMSGDSSKIAALVTAVLYKFGNADLIEYDHLASEVKLNYKDSLFTLASQIEKAQGGTNIESAFNLIKSKYYDKLVIITDQQDFGSDGYQGNRLFNKWRSNNNLLATVVSVDVAGYGNSVMNNNNSNIVTFTAYDRQVVQHIINTKMIDLVEVINQSIDLD